MDSAGGVKQRTTGEQLRRVPQMLIIDAFVYHMRANNTRGKYCRSSDSGRRQRPGPHQPLGASLSKSGNIQQSLDPGHFLLKPALAPYHNPLGHGRSGTVHGFDQVSHSA